MNKDTAKNINRLSPELHELWVKSITQNDSKTLQQLIKTSPININDIMLQLSPKQSGNPLMTASYFGHRKCVKLLLDSGADPDWRHPSKSSTALHVAAKYNRATVVTLLLQYKANPNLVTKPGWTPLGGAVYYSSIKCISPLIESGADMNWSSPGKPSPLIRAMEYTNSDSLRVMVKYLTPSNLSPLMHALGQASSHPKSKCVDILLPVYRHAIFNTKCECAEGPYYNTTPLSLACSLGLIKYAKQLVKWGARINHEFCIEDGIDTALTESARCVSFKGVKFLLDNGAHANNVHGIQPLNALIEHWQEDPASPDRWSIKYKHSANLQALIKRAIKVMDLLIDKGSNIDRYDLHDETPLLTAIRSNAIPYAERLIYHGADVNLGYPATGQTPLMVAAVSDSVELFQALLEKGADPAILDKKGKSFLNDIGPNVKIWWDKYQAKTLTVEGRDKSSIVSDVTLI